MKSRLFGRTTLLWTLAFAGLFSAAIGGRGLAAGSNTVPPGLTPASKPYAYIGTAKVRGVLPISRRNADVSVRLIVVDGEVAGVGQLR